MAFSVRSFLLKYLPPGWVMSYSQFCSQLENYDNLVDSLASELDGCSQSCIESNQFKGSTNCRRVSTGQLYRMAKPWYFPVQRTFHKLKINLLIIEHSLSSPWSQTARTVLHRAMAHDPIHRRGGGPETFGQENPPPDTQRMQTQVLMSCILRAPHLNPHRDLLSLHRWHLQGVTRESNLKPCDVAPKDMGRPKGKEVHFYYPKLWLRGTWLSSSRLSYK